jgi:hypothetical protein
MTAPRLSIQPPYRITTAGQVTHLNRQEALFLLALMGRREMTAFAAAEILWPHPDFMPDTWRNRLGVLVSCLRAKMRPFGWTIETRHGFGWRLERYEPAEHHQAA